MTSRSTARLAQILALTAYSLALVTPAFAAGLGLPSVSLPSLPILGGGSSAVTVPGSSGGGIPGVGGSGGAPGGFGSGATQPAGSLNLQLSTIGMGDPHNPTGPDEKFGDPLSADLFGNGTVKAHLRYYGESGGNGTAQAVGLNFTFAQ